MFIFFPTFSFLVGEALFDLHRFVFFFSIFVEKFHEISDEGQYLERLNVERPIFRNSEISNIKMTNDQLLDFLFSNLFFLFKLFEHSKYIIIYQIGNFWNLAVWKINKFLELFQFGKPKFGPEN